MTADELIELLRLEPLPVEGGHFRQTYVASEALEAAALPERYMGSKPATTIIYYLLTDDADSFSALHKLPTDEVYHFYLGDPVEHVDLHPDGSVEVCVLGHDLGAGQRVQHVAPRDCWQGSRLVSGGRFALMGTSMTPGFTVDDYVGGERDALTRAYPEQAERIRALTRPDAPLSMTPS